MGLAAQLANENTLNLNVYKKKDPEQQYSGFGYALNNLMRNNPLSNISNYSSGLGYPSPMMGLGVIGNVLGAGTNFLADMIWGNKYEK